MSLYAANGKTPTAAWIPSRDDAGNGTTTLNDLEGSNNGTLTNFALSGTTSNWVTDTDLGGVRALDFDGVNDHIAFSATSFAGDTSQLSISAWIKRPTVGTLGPFVGLGNGTSTNRIEIQPWNDGLLYVTFTSSIYGWISLDQNWHHYVVVYDGTQTGNANRLKIYRDGVLQTLSFAGTIPATVGSDSLTTRIGLSHAGNYGVGRVDDVRLFSSLLNDSDVLFLTQQRGVTASQTNLLTGLVSYWKLDEASGNAVDAVSSQTLTAVNSPGSTAGRIGTCRSFNFANSRRFTRTKTPELAVGDFDFTIQAWVQVVSNPGANNSIVARWTTSGNNRAFALLTSSTGVFRLIVSSNGSSLSLTRNATAFGDAPLNTWLLVHAWHDSVNDEVGIAVNAGSPDISSYSSGIFNDNGNWQIGAFNDANHWDGLIDEVGFWKRVLTSGERTRLYNGGSGLSYDDFLALPQVRRRRSRSGGGVL
jgi:hypothetical protein